MASTEFAVAERTDSGTLLSGNEAAVNIIADNSTGSLIPKNTSTTSRTKPRFLLQGRIEHSEFIQPMEAQLQPGAALKLDNLPKLEPANHWVKIPDWFAGTWVSTGVTQNSLHKYGQGIPETYDRTTHFYPSMSIRIRGYQRDRSGQIWYFCGTPSTLVDYNLSTIQNIHSALSLDLVEGSKEKVIFKNLDQSTYVDLKRFTVTFSEQRETIETFTPAGDGVVHASSSSRSFNSQGVPYKDAQLESSWRRIKPFENVNTKDGRDLKQLFRNFLKDNGREDLIPQ